MMLITGATGMIGGALCEHLVSLGAPVRLAVRSVHNAETILKHIVRKPQVEVIACDFSSADESAISRLIYGCDTVVHVAGLVHRPRERKEAYDLVNRHATVRLAEAARSAGVDKFVFLSTIGVYGSVPLYEVTEESPTRPDTFYAESKLAAEEALSVVRPAKHTLIYRPALVYGPRDRGNMLSLIQQVLKRRYFHIGNAAARKSLIHCQDLARAIVLGLEKSSAGVQVFNVANPQAPTVREIANSIAAAGGLDTPIPSIPEVLVRTGSYASLLMGGLSPLPPSRFEKLIKSSTCSVKKLQNITGFEPLVSLIDGLKDEISWLLNSATMSTDGISCEHLNEK